jgi:hypothetical protein
MIWIYLFFLLLLVHFCCTWCIAKHAGNCSAGLSVADTTRHGERDCGIRCVCVCVCVCVYAHCVYRISCHAGLSPNSGQSVWDLCWTGVPKTTSIFPCQYHFANAPSVVSVQRRHVSVCWQHRTSLSTGLCLQPNTVTVSVPDSTPGSPPSTFFHFIMSFVLYRLTCYQLRQVPQLTNLLCAAQSLLKTQQSLS